MNIQEIIDSPYAWLAMVFILALLIQLFYYLRYFLKVASWKKSKAANAAPKPLSVIICARNEASNLKKNLPEVLGQKYPNFEVIVVNDASEDDSDMVLSELKEKHKNLKITNLPINEKFTHGKKLAITVGVKSAQHEWCVFTDADCLPQSDQWLMHMSKEMTDEKEIVLGYGPYEQKKSLLNNYIRYDAFFIALQYLGFAWAKNPYMGVGRNMAYKKSLFFKNKGFGNHYHLLSGDDDLFVNTMANNTNTAVCQHPGSFMYSQASAGVASWFKQKKRHFSTYKYYKGKHKFALGLELFSRVLLYTSFAALLAIQFYPVYVLISFGTRFILQLTIFGIAQNKLKEKNLVLTSILFDVIALFINFGIDLSKRLTRKKVHGGKW